MRFASLKFFEPTLLENFIQPSWKKKESHRLNILWALCKEYCETDVLLRPFDSFMELKLSDAARKNFLLKSYLLSSYLLSVCRKRYEFRRSKRREWRSEWSKNIILKRARKVKRRSYATGNQNQVPGGCTIRKMKERFPPELTVDSKR